MGSGTHHTNHDAADVAGDARRAQRNQPDDLVCNLGQVLDLSASGARIRGEGKCIYLSGQSVELVIQSPNQSFTAQASIRWVKKVALFEYELGIEFTSDIAPFIADPASTADASRPAA